MSLSFIQAQAGARDSALAMLVHCRMVPRTWMKPEEFVKLDEVKEELNGFIASNPSVEVEKMTKELSSFENGKYTTTIRMLYYS